MWSYVWNTVNPCANVMGTRDKNSALGSDQGTRQLLQFPSFLLVQQTCGCSLSHPVGFQRIVGAFPKALQASCD